MTLEEFKRLSETLARYSHLADQVTRLERAAAAFKTVKDAGGHVSQMSFSMRAVSADGKYAKDVHFEVTPESPDLFPLATFIGRSASQAILGELETLRGAMAALDANPKPAAAPGESIFDEPTV
jgi:hypothetical protein